MELTLIPDEIALQARAREFSQSVVRPRAAAVDREEQYPWDIVKALTEAGFLGMTLPKARGGQGCSFLDALLVIEEMAKSCTVTARIVVETNMGAISTVMAYGSEAQKKLAAGLVLAGDKPAICITEPDAGSDTTAMITRADRRGDVYVINGKKHWITGAGVSKLHLIFARVFDERGEELGVGGFLAVRDEAKGLRVTKREQTMGLRGMPEGELTFENLEVSADMAVLPPSGFRRGFADLMNAYNSQRVGAGTVAMKDYDGGQPTGALADQINKDFGSFDNFKKQLNAASSTVFGSGWGALVWEPVLQRLITTQIYDHQSNFTLGGTPIMVVDAWEHAWYLQYQNRKAEFFDALWNVWNWDDISARLEEAKKHNAGLPGATAA